MRICCWQGVLRALCAAFQCGRFCSLFLPALHPELKAAITQFITENKVVLFMKGTKAAVRSFRAHPHFSHY